MGSKSGPPQVSTTTQNNLPPAYVQEAQQNLLDTGKLLASPFTGNAPAFGVAGFNPDQEMAFDLARQSAQDAYTAPRFSVNPGQWSVDPAAIPTTAAPNAERAGPAQRASAQHAGVEQLTAADIAGFQNPYENQVVQTTLGDMSRKFDETSASARARLAAGGAFGGSRQAVMENGMARDFGDTVARTAAGLRHQGFTTAAELGRSNAQMRQQGGQFNATQDNTIGLANAQMGNQQRQFDASQANQVNANNAKAINENYRRNADYLQQARMANTSNALQGATLNNTFANDDLARRQSALRSLLGVGTLQQGTAQQALNQPMDWLKVLGQITPGNAGSTGTSQTSQPTQTNPIGTATGAITALTGLLGLFSDEDEKTNKQKLGKDPRTGLDIYAYDYKADVAAAKKSGKPMPPKRVGPMAQQIEQKHPGSTASVDGKRVVKPSALRAMIGA